MLAGRVWIWLGDGTEASDKFMEEVREIAAADDPLASSIKEMLRNVELLPVVLFRQGGPEFGSFKKQSWLGFHGSYVGSKRSPGKH
jgi:hypothetical protein